MRSENWDIKRVRFEIGLHYCLQTLQVNFFLTILLSLYTCDCFSFHCCRSFFDAAGIGNQLHSFRTAGSCRETVVDLLWWSLDRLILQS